MLDEHLEHHLNQLLLADDELSSQRIKVIASRGVVTLAGQVQTFRRKLAAQELVQAAAHVREVRNELEVASPNWENDQDIALQVNQEIDALAGVKSDSVRVDAKTGKVALTGYVSTERDKLRVADVATSVDGVSEVSNLLVVNPDQVAKNQQHARRIIDSLRNVIGMENCDSVRVSVVDETARLSGRVDAVWKKEQAETLVTQFGILNVSNEISIDPHRGETL